jgi:hypothetical protein
MPITGDPNAVAVVTYKAVPLSMGDCYIKIVPEAAQVVFEVVGQFIGIDSAEPTFVTGALRNTAEDYIAAIVEAVEGIVVPQEITGPLGKRIIFPADAIAGTLANPFADSSYEDVYLTGVQSQDNGGKHFSVTYTFVKPVTVTDDGTEESTILFGTTPVGNRGGFVSVSADSSTLRLSTTSYYVGANPLTYIADLCNTLGHEPVNVTPVPRAAAGSRAAIRSYNAAKETLTWTGKGSVANCYLESLSSQEDTPGITTINASFVSSR